MPYVLAADKNYRFKNQVFKKLEDLDLCGDQLKQSEFSFR
jgi:hypothetical protein